MNRLYSIKDKYYDWLNRDSINFFEFLIRVGTIVPGIFFVVTIKVMVVALYLCKQILKWFGNKVRPKKETEPMYVDGESLVQDWRGFVIRQDEHRRMWGFEGYPATHATDCTCIRCQTATHRYAEVTGYLRTTPTWPSRRQVFAYLSRQTFDYPWIKKEEDFSPKKKIKSHKLVERKRIMRRPGVYTREVDHSTIDLTTYPSSSMNLVQVLGRERRNRDE